MSDDLQWFAPKRFGYGAGPPISWQGWALTLGFVTVVAAVAVVLRNNAVQLIAALTPVTIVFLIICARTTRGGWRWRWGDED
jgi:hypothetical protein